MAEKRCGGCGIETDREWVLWDVLSCSAECDDTLDDLLEDASAHLVDPSTPEAEGVLLTPRLEDGERLRLLVTEEDHNKLRRGSQAHNHGVGRHFGRIMDLITGLSYEMYGAACAGSRTDGGCWCDAVVVPVEDNA